MNRIIEVLIDRDNMTEEGARTMMDNAHEQVMNGEDPDDVLMNDFGLDPDYFLDPMEWA